MLALEPEAQLDHLALAVRERTEDHVGDVIVILSAIININNINASGNLTALFVYLITIFVFSGVKNMSPPIILRL